MASDWLNYFRLFYATAKWNTTKVYIFWPTGKPRLTPWSLIDRHLWFVLGTAQRNSTKLDGSKIATSFSKLRCFGPDRKTKMATLVSGCLIHFRLLCKRWTEFHEAWTRQYFNYRSVLNLLYKASDLLRHFRLLLCNRWKEFQETWRRQDINVSTRFVFRCNWAKGSSAVLWSRVVHRPSVRH